jgi:hypothetical protein
MAGLGSQFRGLLHSAFRLQFISARQVSAVKLSSPQHLTARKDSIMQKRKPGNLEVSAIGLGCMSMSFGYGPAGDKQEIASIPSRLSAMKRMAGVCAAAVLR